MATQHTERAVLKCILDDNNLMAVTQLEPRHFFTASHQLIFHAMNELAKEGKPIDNVTLIENLYDNLAQIGGTQIIAEIQHEKVDKENFRAYEKIIIEKWQLAEYIRLKNTEIRSLEDAAELNKKLTELSTLTDDDEYDHKQEILDLHQEIESQEKGMSGYDTGFTDLNSYLDGLQREDLIIVAGRPSAGKTAFALNIANNHCLNNQRVAIFSLEMPKRQLQKRMLSAIGNINGAKMRNPNAYFNDDDWKRYTNSLGIFSKYKLHIYDQSGQTVSYIRSKVRQLRKDYPNDDLLVVIDYLQLIRSTVRYERKDIEIGEITRSLKELARDEKVPVVVLSQLNRGVEQRQNKRPMMSDIRDSGAVEQDADVIAMLYRDDYYDKESDKANIIEVIIAKQRNGPLGTVELYFKKEFNKFLNLERNYETQRSVKESN